MNLRVKRLSSSDRDEARRLFILLAEIFKEDCGPLSGPYLDQLLRRREFWALAAFTGDTIIGGVVAHTLPMTRTESSELLIYDLAVCVDHRKRGVGRRLVDELCNQAFASGIYTAFVPADNDDIHALDFYRSIGGTSSPVTMFSFQHRT
jgi:aminoglycoside 3-N-acetyltransferase I